MTQDDQAPKRYALRITERAERDIDAHTVRAAEFSGAGAARDWHRGLFEIAASLSESPGRCPVVSEAGRFRREVRQLLYRPSVGGPVWRILFTVDEGGEEAPTVNLIHIRHGAQRPITRVEARQIEAGQ